MNSIFIYIYRAMHNTRTYCGYNLIDLVAPRVATLIAHKKNFFFPLFFFSTFHDVKPTNKNHFYGISWLPFGILQIANTHPPITVNKLFTDWNRNEPILKLCWSASDIHQNKNHFKIRFLLIYPSSLGTWKLLNKNDWKPCNFFFFAFSPMTDTEFDCTRTFLLVHCLLLVADTLDVPA